MTEWLDVPVRPRDALRALWAHFMGRPYLMRVELIADRKWFVIPSQSTQPKE